MTPDNKAALEAFKEAKSHLQGSFRYDKLPDYDFMMSRLEIVERFLTSPAANTGDVINLIVTMGKELDRLASKYEPHPDIPDENSFSLSDLYDRSLKIMEALRGKAALAPRQVDVEELKREVCQQFDKIEGSKYGFEYGAIQWVIDHLAQRGLIGNAQSDLEKPENQTEIEPIQQKNCKVDYIDGLDGARME